MSKRTDVFRSAVEAANAGTDLSGWFEEHATEDVVFYAPLLAGRPAAGRLSSTPSSASPLRPSLAIGSTATW